MNYCFTCGVRAVGAKVRKMQRGGLFLALRADADPSAHVSVTNSSSTPPH